MSKHLDRKAITILAILTLASLSYRLWDIDTPNETWDEGFYYNAGIKYVENVVKLDFYTYHWNVNYEHPPIAKYLYGVINCLFSRDVLNLVPSRVLSALLGAITCLIVFFTGEELFDRRTGFLAALMLGFQPHFVAHTKIAGLESPACLFYTLTVYLFLKAMRRGGNNKYYVFSAVACGLAIGTRLDNVTLFVLIPVLYLLYLRKERTNKNKVTTPTFLLTFPVIVLTTFIASWPWLWHRPYYHLLLSLGLYFPASEFFLGNCVQPPVYYFLVYFLATTPIILLLLFAVAVYKGMSSRDFHSSALLLWFGIPLLLLSFTPLKQDGVRYIFTTYPPFSLLSSIGLLHVVDRIRESAVIAKTKKLTLLKRPLTLCLYALVLASLMGNCLYIHPYYLDYYNGLVGGPYSVYRYRLFEIGWWGEGIGEATDFLNQNAEANATVRFFIMPCRSSYMNVRQDIVIVDSHNMSDYVIVNTYYKWYVGDFIKIVTVGEDEIQLIYDLWHVVRAGGVPLLGYVGAPLAWVYELKETHVVRS